MTVQIGDLPTKVGEVSSRETPVVVIPPHELEHVAARARPLSVTLAQLLARERGVEHRLGHARADLRAYGMPEVAEDAGERGLVARINANLRERSETDVKDPKAVKLLEEFDALKGELVVHFGGKSNDFKSPASRRAWDFANARVAQLLAEHDRDRLAVQLGVALSSINGVARGPKPQLS